MPTSGDDTAERTSLGSLASGACVIDRTGEDTLGVSALSAIDGNPDSGWVGPAQDLPPVADGRTTGADARDVDRTAQHDEAAVRLRDGTRRSGERQRPLRDDRHRGR